jgi:hypothetical protein
MVCVTFDCYFNRARTQTSVNPGKFRRKPEGRTRVLADLYNQSHLVLTPYLIPARGLHAVSYVKQYVHLRSNAMQPYVA